jgi:hypothetical protein
MTQAIAILLSSDSALELYAQSERQAELSASTQPA